MRDGVEKVDDVFVRLVVVVALGVKGREARAMLGDYKDLVRGLAQIEGRTLMGPEACIRTALRDPEFLHEFEEIRTPKLDSC